MKITKKDLTDTNAKLTISLDKEDLDAAELVATSKLAKTTKVPGFRTGKAPASAAKRYIDPHKLDHQILDDAISKAVAESFMSEGVRVLVRPEVDIKSYVPGQSLEFTAEAERLPDVTLGDYKNLKATKAKVSVSENDINHSLGHLQEDVSEKKPVDRAAKNGDEVVLDFVGKKDDVPFEGGAANDYSLKIGSNSFIPGFEEGMIGKKAGDKFDLNLKFPEDYHVEDLAGQLATFSVNLKSVNEVALPELNDEFAQKVSPFKTLKELKDDIKAELKRQMEADVDRRFKDDLVSDLIKVSKVAVPKVLLDDQIRQIEQDTSQNLAYQGNTLDQYIKSRGYDSKEAWISGEVEPAAKSRVQMGLVLAEVSKVENITASTKEVDEQIEELRKRYQNSQEMIAQLERPETRQDIASNLLTEKTIDHLVSLNPSQPKKSSN